MSTEVETKEKRIRRPAPRHSGSVIAAIEERLLILEASKAENVDIHAARFRELFDELKRSLGKKGDADGE